MLTQLAQQAGTLRAAVKSVCAPPHYRSGQKQHRRMCEDESGGPSSPISYGERAGVWLAGIMAKLVAIAYGVTSHPSHTATYPTTTLLPIPHCTTTTSAAPGMRATRLAGCLTTLHTCHLLVRAT